MLDRKFIVENADLVKQNCQRRGARADVAASCSWRPHRKSKQFEVDELNRQANEVSKSIGKAKDADEREARKEEGRALREQTYRRTGTARRHYGRGRRDPARRFPTCRTPTRRSAPTTKSNLELRRGNAEPPQVRLQAARPRRTGREARPDRFRRRRQSHRARLLLPQERRRAAGIGPAALRARAAGGAKASRPRSRPIWPATKSWKASASFPADRKRRSTASPTPT